MRASGFAVSNVCGILQRTAERGCPLRVSTNCFNSGIDWRSCPRFDSCGIIVGAVWELSTIFGGAFCRRRRRVLRGVTGFESSLVLAPVLSIILGPVEAVAITLLIGISASIFLIPRYLADYDRDTVLPLSLAGIGRAWRHSGREDGGRGFRREDTWKADPDHPCGSSEQAGQRREYCAAMDRR